MKRRLFVAALLSAPLSLASEGSVIEAGREREVLALLSPFQPGQEITGDWKLWNVSIGARAIELELQGPGGASARLRLREREDAGETSASFGVERDASTREGAARSAADAVVAALRKNDAGGFWHARPVVPEREAPPQAAMRGIGWPLGVGLASVAAMLWLARNKGRSRALLP